MKNKLQIYIVLAVVGAVLGSSIVIFTKFISPTEKPDKEFSSTYHMECEEVVTVGIANTTIYRCENIEAICYKAGTGIACNRKEEMK